MNDQLIAKIWILGFLVGGTLTHVSYGWTLFSAWRHLSRSTRFQQLRSTSSSIEEKVSTERKRKIQIEQISSKARALDAFVFRGLQISAATFCQRQAQETNTTWSYVEAVDELMKGYDEYGDPLRSVPSPHMTAKQFAAILVEDKDDDEFCDSNGLVGIIRAQARNTNATKANDSVTSTKQSIQFVRPEPFIPYQSDAPHVYLSNLRVSERMQRQGIGGALVRAVLEYAETMGLTHTVLTVEKDNCNAISLYERKGFVVDGEIFDGDVTMVHTSTGGMLSKAESS